MAAEENSRDDRMVEVPEGEARLEAFKHALLLALRRLPGAARSELANKVEEEAWLVRWARGADHERIAFHLEDFARFVRLTPPP
jgi:hypothetical protein